jgi:hypothetical protein
VTLKVAPTLWPCQRHVRAVTIRWLPPLAPDRALFAQLRADVADFLRLDPAQVEQASLDLGRRRVTFTRAAPPDVPARFILP